MCNAWYYWYVALLHSQVTIHHQHHLKFDTVQWDLAVYTWVACNGIWLSILGWRIYISYAITNDPVSASKIQDYAQTSVRVYCVPECQLYNAKDIYVECQLYNANMCVHIYQSK